jgi:hypothetical protein
MGVISVRLLDDDEAWLAKRNLKPGTFARDAVHDAIRRLEIKAAREFLDANRVKFDKTVTEMVREDRDRR